jgi:sulfur carrier protein ThiS
MIVEVDDVFLKEATEKKIVELNFSKPKKIKEILREIDFKDFGYANYFLNGNQVNLEDFADSDDKLTVLPIFGGG